MFYGRAIKDGARMKPKYIGQGKSFETDTAILSSVYFSTDVRVNFLVFSAVDVLVRRMINDSAMLKDVVHGYENFNINRLYRTR
jgi:ABC-type thiamine transport system substrate-binding protein